MESAFRGGEGALEELQVFGFRGVLRLRKLIAFEGAKATDLPTVLSHFIHKIGFGGVGGLMLFDETGAKADVIAEVLVGQNDALGVEAVLEGVAGCALLAFGGFGTGGVLCVLAIDRRAIGFHDVASALTRT